MLSLNIKGFYQFSGTEMFMVTFITEFVLLFFQMGQFFDWAVCPPLQLMQFSSLLQEVS